MRKIEIKRRWLLCSFLALFHLFCAVGAHADQTANVNLMPSTASPILQYGTAAFSGNNVVVNNATVLTTISTNTACNQPGTVYKDNLQMDFDYSNCNKTTNPGLNAINYTIFISGGTMTLYPGMKVRFMAKDKRKIKSITLQYAANNSTYTTAELFTTKFTQNNSYNFYDRTSKTYTAATVGTDIKVTTSTWANGANTSYQLKFERTDGEYFDGLQICLKSVADGAKKTAATDDGAAAYNNPLLSVGANSAGNIILVTENAQPTATEHFFGNDIERWNGTAWERPTQTEYSGQTEKLRSGHVIMEFDRTTSASTAAKTVTLNPQRGAVGVSTGIRFRAYLDETCTNGAAQGHPKSIKYDLSGNLTRTAATTFLTRAAAAVINIANLAAYTDGTTATKHTGANNVAGPLLTLTNAGATGLTNTWSSFTDPTTYRNPFGTGTTAANLNVTDGSMSGGKKPLMWFDHVELLYNSTNYGAPAPVIWAPLTETYYFNCINVALGTAPNPNLAIANADGSWSLTSTGATVTAALPTDADYGTLTLKYLFSETPVANPAATFASGGGTAMTLYATPTQNPVSHYKATVTKPGYLYIATVGTSKNDNVTRASAVRTLHFTNVPAVSIASYADLTNPANDGKLVSVDFMTTSTFYNQYYPNSNPFRRTAYLRDEAGNAFKVTQKHTALASIPAKTIFNASTYQKPGTVVGVLHVNDGHPEVMLVDGTADSPYDYQILLPTTAYTYSTAGLSAAWPAWPMQSTLSASDWGKEVTITGVPSWTNTDKKMAVGDTEWAVRYQNENGTPYSYGWPAATAIPAGAKLTVKGILDAEKQSDGSWAYYFMPKANSIQASLEKPKLTSIANATLSDDTEDGIDEIWDVQQYSSVVFNMAYDNQPTSYNVIAPVLYQGETLVGVKSNKLATIVQPGRIGDAVQTGYITFINGEAVVTIKMGNAAVLNSITSWSEPLVVKLRDVVGMGSTADNMSELAAAFDDVQSIDHTTYVNMTGSTDISAPGSVLVLGINPKGKTMLVADIASGTHDVRTGILYLGNQYENWEAAKNVNAFSPSYYQSSSSRYYYYLWTAGDLIRKFSAKVEKLDGNTVFNIDGLQARFASTARPSSSTIASAGVDSLAAVMAGAVDASAGINASMRNRLVRMSGVQLKNNGGVLTAQTATPTVVDVDMFIDEATKTLALNYAAASDAVRFDITGTVLADASGALRLAATACEPAMGSELSVCNHRDHDSYSGKHDFAAEAMGTVVSVHGAELHKDGDTYYFDLAKRVALDGLTDEQKTDIDAIIEYNAGRKTLHRNLALGKDIVETVMTHTVEGVVTKAADGTYRVAVGKLIVDNYLNKREVYPQLTFTGDGTSGVKFEHKAYIGVHGYNGTVLPEGFKAMLRIYPKDLVTNEYPDSLAYTVELDPENPYVLTQSAKVYGLYCAPGYHVYRAGTNGTILEADSITDMAMATPNTYEKVALDVPSIDELAAKTDKTYHYNLTATLRVTQKSATALALTDGEQTIFTTGLTANNGKNLIEPGMTVNDIVLTLTDNPGVYALHAQVKPTVVESETPAMPEVVDVEGALSAANAMKLSDISPVKVSGTTATAADGTTYTLATDITALPAGIDAAKEYVAIGYPAQKQGAMVFHAFELREIRPTATPTLTAAKNPFTGSTTLTAACAEDAAIVLSINGADPTAYTEPVTVDSTCTVTATATARWMQPSAEATLALTRVYETSIAATDDMETSKTKIALSANGAGAGVTIRYTLDGTEPTKESTLYTAPFALTDNATVKAVALTSAHDSIFAGPTATEAVTVMSGKVTVNVDNATAGIAVVTFAPAVETTEKYAISYSLDGGPAIQWNGQEIEFLYDGEDHEISATLTVEGHRAGAPATAAFRVRPIVATDFSFSTDGIAAYAPGEVKVLIGFTPSNASIRTMSWTSSNPEVATVDADGVVSLKAVGTATLTATTTDGSNISKSIEVVGLAKNVNVSQVLRADMQASKVLRDYIYVTVARAVKAVLNNHQAIDLRPGSNRIDILTGQLLQSIEQGTLRRMARKADAGDISDTPSTVSGEQKSPFESSAVPDALVLEVEDPTAVTGIDLEGLGATSLDIDESLSAIEQLNIASNAFDFSAGLNQNLPEAIKSAVTGGDRQNVFITEYTVHGMTVTVDKKYAVKPFMLAWYGEDGEFVDHSRKGYTYFFDTTQRYDERGDVVMDDITGQPVEESLKGTYVQMVVTKPDEVLRLTTEHPILLAAEADQPVKEDIEEDPDVEYAEDLNASEREMLRLQFTTTDGSVQLPEGEHWYDLQGREVRQPREGEIYIHILDGKATKVRY